MPSPALRLDFGQRLSGYAPAPGPRAADSAQLQTLQGETMGTRWQLSLVNTDMRPLAEVRAIVQAQLDLVIAQMSHWVPDSLISRFNAADAGTRFALPPEFAQVLQAGLRWAQASGGAFDPAAGRLVAAWGFGPHAARELPPSEALLLALRQAASWRDLEMTEYLAPRQAEAPATATAPAPGPAPSPAHAGTGTHADTHTLAQPGGLWLDFSGIAKGFAVDLVSQALQAAGIAHSLIDIGGELRATGTRPGGQPWRVQLDAGAGDEPSLQAAPVLALRDQAVATSGSRWHRHQHGGQAWNHTVDPRTGLASLSPLQGVSVLHPSCMQADALATTLWVLGLPDALAFANAHGVAARLCGVNGEIHATAQWQEAENARYP